MENSAVVNYWHGNRRVEQQLLGQLFVTFRRSSLRALWADTLCSLCMTNFVVQYELKMGLLVNDIFQV